MNPSISPAVCQSCGACCSLMIDGELVACRHLRTNDGKFACSIYDTRPMVCRDYSCVRDGSLSDVVADRALAAMEVA